MYINIYPMNHTTKSYICFTPSSRLLFVDGWNKTLSSVGLDGEDVTLVASLSDLTGDNPVYGLTVVNDTAYVSVWGSGSVVRVPMEEGAASPTTILDGLSRDVMFSMASTDPASQPAGRGFTYAFDQLDCKICYIE